jgi:ABC-2 type transport system ATP-binding protein
MITVTDLHKNYGKKRVLEHVSLTIEPGTCVGLLGNNGAGKSTLIHILLDLIPKTSGEVSLFGMSYPADTVAIRKRIGVMPEEELIHDELTGKEQLDFACMLYGIPDAEREARIHTLFEFFFEDAGELHKPCGTYSAGMRKKLGMIIALLHKPDVLILDEPFSGLDPAASQVLIRFLSLWLNERRAILVSSHNLNYVEQMASHVAVIHERRLAFYGTLATFLESGSGLIDQTLFTLLKSEPKSHESLQWLLD